MGSYRSKSQSSYKVTHKLKPHQRQKVAKAEKPKPKPVSKPPMKPPVKLSPSKVSPMEEVKKRFWKYAEKVAPVKPPVSKVSAPEEETATKSTPTSLTDEERRKAMLVPVPDKGPIPTPYIDWDAIPARCCIDGINYMDYPLDSASNGLLPELREMFGRSRRYQNSAPVNVIITGPKGTGKSEVVKKFADDTKLPYWGVIGQEGIRADELLGHYELKGGTSRWVDGIIPKAVRSGGILHLDEINILEPAILMRLNELMDNKRQLDMEDLNGELVKAHPDLFIVVTMNPPTYEGVKDLPDPIKSRLTKRYKLDYPPPKVEMSILKSKMKLTDHEFNFTGGVATGKYANDITDVMKIVTGLRKQTDLSYTPSMRETQGFIQDLKEGDNFFTAFDRNIGNWYYGDEKNIVDEALNSVRKR